MNRTAPLRRSPMPRARSRMRQASPALAARRREYSRKNAVFAALPENKWCPVAAAGLILDACLASPTGRHRFFTGIGSQMAPEPLVCIYCDRFKNECRRLTIEATDTHHKNGREGKKLLDFSLCIRVSREGHDFIRDHANEARKRGWLI